MKKILILITFLSAVSFATSITIEDVTPSPYLRVNVNGSYNHFESNKIIVTKHFPLIVSIEYVDPTKRKHYVVLKKTYYQLSDLKNNLSHKETIRSVIIDRLRKYVNPKEKNKVDYNRLIEQEFKQEIDTYTGSHQSSIQEKLEPLLSSIDEKIIKIVNQNTKEQHYQKKGIVFEDYKAKNTIENHTLETYVLNNQIIKQPLTLLNSWNTFKQQHTINIPYNTSVVIKMFENDTGKEVLFNYLSPHSNKVGKKYETDNLINYMFDKYLKECTYEYKGQDYCKHFDKVEGVIDSKEKLLYSIKKGLPKNIEEQDTIEKYLIVERTFLNIIMRFSIFKKVQVSPGETINLN